MKKNAPSLCWAANSGWLVRHRTCPLHQLIDEHIIIVVIFIILFQYLDSLILLTLLRWWHIFLYLKYYMYMESINKNMTSNPHYPRDDGGT